MSDDEPMDDARMGDAHMRDEQARDKQVRDEAPTPSGPEPTYDVAGAALGALTPEELSQVRGASHTDAALWDDLVSMEETAAELARLSPTLQINRGRSAGIRSRLTSRAAASREGRSVHPRAAADLIKPAATSGAARVATQAPTPVTETAVQRQQGSGVARGGGKAPSSSPASNSAQRPSNVGAWRFLAAAAVLLAVATGTQLYRVIRDRNALRQAVTARGAAELARITSLQSAVASKDSLIASLTGPNMRVVDLVNYTSQDPVARMFWDQKTQEWIMYAYNLRQPKPGKTFQVWLIANGKPAPISAGTFRPDSKGAAIMHAKYPMDRGALQKVAISEEPDGGMPSPTGPMVLAGR